MKSLVQHLYESVLDADAGIGNHMEILAAVEPLYKTWVNKNDYKGRNISGSIYKIAGPTQQQIVKRMISELGKAGAPNCKDYAVFSKTRRKCINFVIDGNGALIFHSYRNKFDSIEVYFMINRKQHVYKAYLTDEGVIVSYNVHNTSSPIIADSCCDYAYELPKDIAERIFDASEITKR